MIPKIEWPEGKDFTFTIFDDPDGDSVETLDVVYSFLRDLGFRMTKAVWSVRGDGTPKVGGATCEDERYLKEALINSQFHAAGMQNTGNLGDRHLGL